MKAVVTALAAVTVLSAVAGCAADTTPPDGISVTVEQWRGSEVMHQLEIAVHNDSPNPVYVADVQLVTDSFEVLLPKRVGRELQPLPRIDLRIPYGKARCRQDRVPKVSPASVIAHLRAGDEDLREVRFELPHPDALLAKLLRAECEEYLVRQTADFRFAGGWKQSDGWLLGTLVVSRRGSGRPVTVHAIGGSTHYFVRPERQREPVTVLTEAESEQEIPIRIRPSRCDPHAFADAKKAFIFAVWASVGDGEKLYVSFTPPKRTRQLLLDFAVEECDL